MIIITRLLLFVLVFFVSPVHAATLYMGSGETYTDLQTAMAAMSSGDTLIIRDGTYTGASNVLDSTYHPPIGISTSQPTTIQAETDGAVIFDGENTRQMFVTLGTSGGYAWMRFLKFQGIQWVKSSAAAVQLTNGNVDDFTTGDSALTASYIYFKNCGFHSENGVGFYPSYIKQVLVEDCWGWGSGRYNVNPYLCDQVVIRRFVGRLDAVYHDSYYPSANYITYASHDVSFQNCISIDTDSNSFSTTPVAMQPYGGFYVRNSYSGRLTEDTDILGGLIVNYNAQANGGYFTLLVQSDPVNTIIENTVIIGSSRGISVTGLSYDVTVNHVSILDSANQATSSSRQYGFVDESSSGNDYLDINNSCVVGCSFLSVYSYVSSTSDYNGAYGNSSNTMSEGTHNVTSDPAILYPVRIETGSSYDGAASDSGDIGATIIKKIGTDGTFYGEAGYNTTTDNDLWPWPNEDIIKSALSSDYGTTTETRGFAAAGKQLNGTADITLTSYIWEYLGNEIPDEIYGIVPTFSGVVLQ